MACAGASSEIDIKFSIENLSGVGAYLSPILNDRTSNILQKNLEGTEDTSITVDLESGEKYRLAIEQACVCSADEINGSTNRPGGNFSGGDFDDEYLQQQNWHIEF